MPWNNQNGGGGGGGWKSGGGGGGGGPWGQGGGGGGGGGQPPDLEEILKRSQDRMKQVMHGSGLPGPLIFLLAIAGSAVVAWYAFFFRVNPDELGVVMRFGEFVRQEQPGLHFRMPYPIEEVLTPKVTRQRITEIGMRSGTSVRGSGPASRDLRAESQMLTGDENIIDIEFVVYWRIRPGIDPKTKEPGVAQYLFNIQNPEGTVKDIAESAMRDIVGRSEIQPILTGARQKIEQDVQTLMQQKLDSYRAGVQIDQVQLQKVDPPAEVIEAFRDVQAARADMETKKNAALGEANRIVPQARGEAERIAQGAEGYRQQAIAEAQGQTARFNQVLDQYLKAPDVTRRRLFLETMERVLGGSDKIILDKSGGGVIPYLPLDQLNPKQSKTTGGN